MSVKMPETLLNKRKKCVFDAVFGLSHISQPTPLVTPITVHTRPGETFGGPAALVYSNSIPSLDEPRSDIVEDQMQWDRSWHLVTRILQLPGTPIARANLKPLLPERDSIDQEFYHGLKKVLYPQTFVPFARQTEDIVAWHTQQVRDHFLRQVLPHLRTSKTNPEPDAVLLRAVKILEVAHRQYFHGLSFVKEQLDLYVPESSDIVVAKFRRDLYAIIGNSAMELLHSPLTSVLKRHVWTILGLSEKSSIIGENSDSEKARKDILSLVDMLGNVGLAGERFQIIFAEVMNVVLSEYIYRSCHNVWFPTVSVAASSRKGGDVARASLSLARSDRHVSSSSCVKDVCAWVEKRYAKLASQILGIVGSQSGISWANQEKFREMSIGRLAKVRTKELFDIVQGWPQSSAALDDLRAAITTPQRRLHLTEVYSRALSQKLLHPGISTIQILRTYISMIWSFHSLDPSKILLDRVAFPLQSYLRTREDTVRIIIIGLLADIGAGQVVVSRQEMLLELAQILEKGEDLLEQRASNEELEWHDMAWTPDPMDAGYGYKNSKNADVIGSMINFLGSQEVFIMEFQSVLGERILNHDGVFDKELKVLELLKVRFGDAPLQACEVMLRDILDSGRVNHIIKRIMKQSGMANAAKLNLGQSDQAVAQDDFCLPLNAKILSRLFWPSLQDAGCRVPDQVAYLQAQYEAGFESLKASRKLTWLQTLGQVTLELEFVDRIVVEEVTTWQATIIWAFQGEIGNVNLEKTVDQLVFQLGMDEATVRHGLKFWVQKSVLKEMSPTAYGVLERLDQEDRIRSDATGNSFALIEDSADTTGDSTLKNLEGIAQEKMTVYWQFIHGMLTNSSSQMPLQQVAMILKMSIADGFPYSNEELQEFLAQKVADGELDFVSGRYRLRK